jgi:hypothetical protein
MCVEKARKRGHVSFLQLAERKRNVTAFSYRFAEKSMKVLPS